MNKTLQVAQREAWFQLRRPAFLFAVFGTPLLLIGILFIVFVVTDLSINNDDVENMIVGYVDLAEVFTGDASVPESYLSYNSLSDAEIALDNGDVDIYFVLPPVFLALGQSQVYAYGSVPDPLLDDIELLIQDALIANIDTTVSSDIINDPVQISVFLENNGREVTSEAFIGLFLAPFVFVMVFFMALQLTSTFLMQSVIDEKTNRIMEVLITTISPLQLLAGKLLGLGFIGLFQMTVWVVLAVVGLNLAGDVAFLSAISFPPDLILLSLVYFVLTYFLYASMLAGIGAVTDSEQEGRQLAGVFSFLFVIPLLFITTFMEDPNGGLAVFLTLLPFSSGISVIFRASFGVIPIWQLVASITILIVTTLFFVWVSAKIFRWAILLYGKRPSIGAIFRAAFGNPDIGVLPTTQKES